MDKEIVKCEFNATEPINETEVYDANKDQFLDLVKSYLGQGHVYFCSSFEGTTQVAVEFATQQQGIPVVKLTNIVGIARTGSPGENGEIAELEADQYNVSALEEFLNRYEGKNLVIKDNYAASERRDTVDLVIATLGYTFANYSNRGGDVFIFGQSELQQDQIGGSSYLRKLKLVEFVPYTTSD